MRKKFTLHARDFYLPLGEDTKIMGIINVTPDSFSHDGCLIPAPEKNFTQKAVSLARKFIRQGAHIIDIGGESTRPGAQEVPLAEEIRRVIPAIKILAKNTHIPISVDTYKSSVAQHALDAGASIVNNIKGVRAEKSLLKMVKAYDAGVVLMHMRGTPRTMQKRISYHDLIKEILSSLRNSVEICLEIGIKSDRIIVDPGIGFGKTFEQNLEILNRLGDFQALNVPILIGTSRKSFIGKVLEKDVTERLWGTAASVAIGIANGAHMVRVHDVREIRDVVTMTDAIINQKISNSPKK